MLHTYYLLEKRKRDVFAVAKITYTTDATCVARAESDLKARGYTGGTIRLDIVAQGQKNFKGEIANIPAFII